MKDRIRMLMESKHMTQQVFAQFLELSPATLSSIFNDRTKPTINLVEAIKKKIPDINLEWLMFGTGSMYSGGTSTAAASPEPSPSVSVSSVDRKDPMLDFDIPFSPTPEKAAPTATSFNSVKNTRPEVVREEVKYIDKPQRRVIEIRVFYDDQTWDTFVPAKK